jgi:hypothetical protein
MKVHVRSSEMDEPAPCPPQPIQCSKQVSYKNTLTVCSKQVSYKNTLTVCSKQVSYKNTLTARSKQALCNNRPGLCCSAAIKDCCDAWRHKTKHKHLMPALLLKPVHHLITSEAVCLPCGISIMKNS